jgi:hypothetical protein
MQPQQPLNGRKKILLWAAGLVTSFTAWKLFGGAGGKKQETPDKKTVKMLTEDGRLVEIDQDLLASSQKDKISSSGLQNWIKK